MEELTEEDLRLVHALQIHPRARWGELAAVLGRSAGTLAQHWERLRSRGQAWVTAYPLGASRGECMALVQLGIVPEHLDAAVAELCRMPEAITVEFSTQNRDLVVTVRTRSLAQLTDETLPRLQGLAGVRQSRTSLFTQLYRAGEGWRLAALDEREKAALTRLRQRAHGTPAEAAPTRSSEKDSDPRELPDAVVQLLARDGRATAAALAQAQGVHPSTAQRQLGRIMRHGTLAFRCDVADRAAGYPVVCHWLVRVPARLHDEAARALAGLETVRLCASTTGRTNFLVTMWLGAVEDIMLAEHRMAEKVPQMEIDESVVVLSCLKRVGWLLRPDGTATGEVIA